MRLLGLDPGLRHTGWGVITVKGNHLSYVAAGIIDTDSKLPIAQRLVQLYDGIMQVIDSYKPDSAAVEETFVNQNPASALKLGQARGIVLMAPAKAGLAVEEYAANRIKKAVVGVGHADKNQIEMMVRRLLPGCEIPGADAADALAVAICHASYTQTEQRILAAQSGG